MISDVAMTVVSSSTFRYVWDVDAGGNITDGIYSATVTGVSTDGRSYAGTDSITFTLLSPPSTPSSGPDPDRLAQMQDQVTRTTLLMLPPLPLLGQLALLQVLCICMQRKMAARLLL